MRIRRKRSCLFASAKKTAKRKHTKEICSVWAEKLSSSDKSSYIYNQEKCGWKNLEKNENAVSASRLKILAKLLQHVKREDDGEYCEESWQR